MHCFPVFGGPKRRWACQRRAHQEVSQWGHCDAAFHIDFWRLIKTWEFMRMPILYDIYFSKLILPCICWPWCLCQGNREKHREYLRILAIDKSNKYDLPGEEKLIKGLWAYFLSIIWFDSIFELHYSLYFGPLRSWTTSPDKTKIQDPLHDKCLPISTLPKSQFQKGQYNWIRTKLNQSCRNSWYHAKSNCARETIFKEVRILEFKYQVHWHDQSLKPEHPISTMLYSPFLLRLICGAFFIRHVDAEVETEVNAHFGKSFEARIII